MKEKILLVASLTFVLQITLVVFAFVVVYPAVNELNLLIPEIKKVASNESLSLMMASAVDNKVTELREEVNSNFRSVEEFVNIGVANLSASLSVSQSKIEGDAKLLQYLMVKSNTMVKQETEEVAYKMNSSEQALRNITHNQLLMSGQLRKIDNKLK